MQTNQNSIMNKKNFFEIHKWINPIMPFSFSKSSIEHQPSYGNWHESLEIIRVTGGSGHILCDSIDYELSPGDIITINSNEIHRLTTNSKLYFDYLLISEDFCLQNGFDIKNINFKNKINDEKVWELLSDIEREFFAAKNDESFSIPALRSVILVMLVYLSKNCLNNIEKAKKSKQSEIILTSLKYINDNFCNPLSLENIAKNAGISKYHFLREFKICTGYTVIEYVNTLRCEYAKRLLKSTDYTVSKISEMCGYENLSYFSRTFKTYTGNLPSKYIAQRKERK